MDEMIAFLRTIAENPDADAPRLVFCDWLEEHQHHERAEFIRLQIELARMDPSDEGYPEMTATMRRCGMFTTKGTLPFFDYLPTSECKIVFQRGFIESIITRDAETIDASGFDLIPLQTLRTGSKLIEKFKGFTKLNRLEYDGRDTSPAKLLDIFGPKGWFQNLEELSLPYLDTACLEAGVIPQFHLPRLRNFFLSTAPFYELGAPVASDSDYEDDEDYDAPRPWGGLPDYLPRNALPNSKTPLERFIWHSQDDCDFFGGEEAWYWRGPTMESLLQHLKAYDLKQIEVVVDYDDHEGGTEGVIAAPYQRNPFELSSTLERATLAAGDLRLLEGSSRKLKALRIYGVEGIPEFLFTLLSQPLCSELESLHIENRGGWWGATPTSGPGINFSKLKSLYLSGLPLECFSNCQFPHLISLLGHHELKTILARKWPKLQCLDVNVRSHNLSELQPIAHSDCCPNLTTLTLSPYIKPTQADFSFLANCPHMPFLSLVRIPDYPMDRTYIVHEGKVIPGRTDVVLHEQTPTTSYRISVAF